MKYLLAVLAIFAVIGIWVIAEPIASNRYNEWHVARVNAKYDALFEKLNNRYHCVGGPGYGTACDKKMEEGGTWVADQRASGFCKDPDATKLNSLAPIFYKDYAFALGVKCN